MKDWLKINIFATSNQQVKEEDSDLDNVPLPDNHYENMQVLYLTFPSLFVIKADFHLLVCVGGGGGIGRKNFTPKCKFEILFELIAMGYFYQKMLILTPHSF